MIRWTDPGAAIVYKEKKFQNNTYRCCHLTETFQSRLNTSYRIKKFIFLIDLSIYSHTDENKDHNVSFAT